MIFSIFILLLVALVVYFHYLQGFFSAGISAVLTVIAAMVAIGFHENLVNAVLGGRMAQQAHAIALVCLFAGVYIVLRQIFDRAVPGNLRFPVLVDKIGSAVSGLIAGVFSVGILVIAAQSLPFGPSIAGYSRYPVSFDLDLVVHQQGRSVDARRDELDADRFLNNEPEKLLVPVDDLVLSFADQVTQPGAPLASGTPLTSVHPDYLQELFGQRIGMQIAASRVAQREDSLTILGVYTVASLPQDDQERWMIGTHAVGTRAPDAAPAPPPLPAVIDPPTGQALLVVRAQLGVGAAEKKGNLVSFGPGNVRLVASGKNYFPIGTLEGGRTLLRNMPDDYLFVPAGKAVDLVFEIDEVDVLVPGENKTYQTTPGAFLEFKRLAKEELPRTVAIGVPPPGETVLVLRKEGTRGMGAVAGGGGGAAGPGATLLFQGAPDTQAQLPVGIGVTVQGDNVKGEQDWGTYVVNDRGFARIEVNPTRSVEILARQGRRVQSLYTPLTHAIVQWTGIPQGETKWEWADDLVNYEVVDASGTRYKPHGAAARLINSNGGNMLVARYDAERELTSIPTSSDMKPSEVTLYWVLPSQTTLRSMDYKGQVVQSVNLRTP